MHNCIAVWTDKMLVNYQTAELKIMYMLLMSWWAIFNSWWASNTVFCIKIFYFQHSWWASNTQLFLLVHDKYVLIFVDILLRLRLYSAALYWQISSIDRMASELDLCRKKNDFAEQNLKFEAFQIFLWRINFKNNGHSFTSHKSPLFCQKVVTSIFLDLQYSSNKFLPQFFFNFFFQILENVKVKYSFILPNFFKKIFLKKNLRTMLFFVVTSLFWKVMQKY